MTGAVGAASAWASEIAWQAGLLAIAVLAADLALRRFGCVRLRHGLWLLVLVRFALPPSISSPVSVVAAFRDGAAPATSYVAADASGLALAAVAVWAVGALVVAGIAIARSAAYTRSIVRGAAPAPSGIRALLRRAAATMAVRRVPRLVVSHAARGVALVGVLRPVVVVPASAPADRATFHALVHELAHHRRRDVWVAWGATAVRCVFWWHPAAWFAASRVADLREICSDLDAAAALGERATEYRATLLDAARRLVGDTPAAPAVAWFGARGIAARVEAMTGPLHPRSALSRVGVAAALGATAACALPMGAALQAASVPADRGPDDGSDHGLGDGALARQVLADAASGRSRPGCVRIKYAAMRIAAEDTTSRRRDP